MICSKTERIKKFIVLSCIVLCVFLCTACSAGKTDNIAADAVISSVKEKIIRVKMKKFFQHPAELLC